MQGLIIENKANLYKIKSFYPIIRFKISILLLLEESLRMTALLL